MSAVIAFIVVVVIYSDVYEYLWQTKVVPIYPGIWFAIICGLALISLLFSFGRIVRTANYSVSRHRQNQKALLVWVAIFTGIVVFSYLFSVRGFLELRSLKNLLIEFVMLVVFLVILRGERELRAGQIAMAVVVLISVLANVVDFLGVYSFSNNEGRAAGLYVNPNISGLHLVLGMILSASILPRRSRLYYCILVGMGVAITFSRASLIMWLLAVWGLAQLQLFRLGRRAMTAIVASLVALVLAMQFGGALVDEFGLDKYLSENALMRLHFNYKTDASVQGRLDLIRKSWGLIEEAPWVGHGFGSHGFGRALIQPHNMFLLIGVELGLLGLFLYSALYIVLWRFGSGLSKVFVAALFVGSLFSHNILEDLGVLLACTLLTGIGLSGGVQRAGRQGTDLFRRSIAVDRAPYEPWRIDPSRVVR